MEVAQGNKSGVECGSLNQFTHTYIIIAKPFFFSRIALSVDVTSEPEEDLWTFPCDREISFLRWTT